MTKLNWNQQLLLHLGRIQPFWVFILPNKLLISFNKLGNICIWLLHIVMNWLTNALILLLYLNTYNYVLQNILKEAIKDWSTSAVPHCTGMTGTGIR